jgi:putative acetyltransferase
MLIRAERASDFLQISELIAAAFAKHPFSKQTEVFIVRELRAAKALTLSLVAEIDNRVVGHIAFSPVEFSDNAQGWFGLGPIAVLPELQRQGVGTALLREGLRQLEELGAQGCVLVGDPGFYERFGFQSSTSFTLPGVPKENILALALAPGEIPSGEVRFHPAFWASA